MTDYRFQEKNDLTDGGAVGVRGVFPMDMPDEYRRHRYASLRDEFSRNLFDAIDKVKHPVVVDIKEERRMFGELGFENRPSEEIVIKAHLTPVRTEHIVMPKYDGPANFVLVSRHLTFWERLKWVFRR